MSDDRRKRLIVNVIVVVGIVAAVGYVAVEDWRDPFNDAAFDAQAWSDAAPADRAAMTRDLLDNHLRFGTVVVNVEKMLGKPDHVLSGAEAKALNRFSERVFVYELGSWDWPHKAHEHTFLYVHFGGERRVSRSEIGGY